MTDIAPVYNAGWGSLTDGATLLVDTAPWIYVLEDHPVFAPRFTGLFEAAELEGKAKRIGQAL